MTKADWLELVKILLGGIISLIGVYIVAKVKQVHRELNSRLDQWKKETADYAAHAVSKAFIEGQMRGSEIEITRVRLDTQTAAAELLQAAREAAKIVLTNAQIQAAKDLETKK